MLVTPRGFKKGLTVGCVILRGDLYFNKLTLQLPDQICNSPCCQPYNSYNVNAENLVLDLGHSWELQG